VPAAGGQAHPWGPIGSPRAEFRPNSAGPLSRGHSGQRYG
jgi:hypothetical protein